MTTELDDFRAGLHRLGPPFAPRAGATPNGTDLLVLGGGSKITANIAPTQDRVSVKFTGPTNDFDQLAKRFARRQELVDGVVRPDRRPNQTESRFQVERKYSDWVANPDLIYSWIRETALVLAAFAT